MTITTKLFSTKVAAAALAVAVVMGFAFAFAAPAKAALSESQIQSILSLLSSFGADTSTINNVNASLRGQATTGTGSTGGTTSSSCTFTKDLTVGSRGTDVTCLQNALIAAGHLAAGNNTGYFGALTQAAVAKWQAAAGVSPAAGYFGAKSRAAFNLGGSTGSTGGTTTPAGSGLTVAAGSQPANSLAPQGTSRVPFTRFTLTAGNDGDVTVNGVTVQRTGLGSDGVFSGIILVDEATGMQLGNSQTFNSNHQTTIGGTFMIPRGTTKTFLVAGNMNSSLTNNAGEVPQISVIAVNTSATVTGSLPITGAAQTINATLSTGSITVASSQAYASNSNQTPNIGDTGRKTAGLRVTAGSAEDLTLKWVRFNQTGSVSATDLANVAVVVNGTSYPLTVSADGKYYAASLGSGVVIAKGNQVDMYVSYDVIGGNSNSRTVIFDVDKTTDIFATGNTYGYGVSPAAPSNVSVPGSRGTLTLTSGTPYIFATQDTIQGASVTTIAKANEVPAQNIAINVQNQPLGGFVVDLKGEAMTVQQMIFSVASSSGSAGGPLTNVTIVDENGSVVAGPYDEAAAGTITFSSSVTFKTGRHIYTIRGKVDSNTTNGATITLSTTPSSQWTNVKGDTSGNTISLSSNGAFSMNVMTVKTGSITIGRATSPASQTLVSGGTSVLMTNFQFDATQSGDDVRFSTAKVKLLTGSLMAAVEKLTSCQLFDGSTALNSGGNVLNPSGTASTTYSGSITLDNPVTVAKGTVKTLSMRCNISSTADNNSTFSWDVQDASNWTFTGATSGTAIASPADATDGAILVTVGSGSVTVTTDAASPGYTIASAGTSGVTSGAFKFRAANENVNLTKMGLTITSSASSSSSDLVKASIFDGATKVGEAYFLGSATTATSTFTSPVTLVKNTDKTLTVKLDFASIGTGQPVTVSGHLVAVDYLNAEGTGAESGTTQLLGAAAGSTSVAGVRVFKSVPTVATDSLPSTGAADGRLMRFKVTADAAGPVGLARFNFTVATSTTGTLVTNINLFGYTDANYSQPVSGVSTGGQVKAANLCGGTAGECNSNTYLIIIPVQTSAGSGATPNTTIQVPAGATRYFELRGSVTTVNGSSIVTTLKGDTAFHSTANSGFAGVPMLAVASTSLGTSLANFIWSPNSTTTSVVGDVDWTEGYGVPGLPGSGIIQSRSN